MHTEKGGIPLENDQNYFFYPDDLKKKAVFICWTGINVTAIAAAFILSCFIFFLTFAWFPILLTVIYMLLTATNGERSLADYILDYINYLFIDQLEFVWSEPDPISVRRTINDIEKEA